MSNSLPGVRAPGRANVFIEVFEMRELDRARNACAAMVSAPHDKMFGAMKT
jgi:hypothetical protein